MRPYYYCYIVTGPLLILLIIDFAVAAPVLVQEKRQAGVGVVRIPEDTKTMLKRGDEWKLWLDILRSDLLKESPAARPLSSSPPSGPADGLTGVKQPLPFVPKETSPVSNPDDELWVNLFGHPESYFFEHPSSLTDVEKPLPSVPKETSPVSSPDAESNELWVNFFGHPESYFFEHLSSLTDVEQPLPSVPKETSPVSSPDAESDELWVNLFGHPESYFFEHSSSSSLPSGHTDGLTDVEQPLRSIPKEPSPVSHADRAPPSPGYELTKGDVPPGPSGASGPAS